MKRSPKKKACRPKIASALAREFCVGVGVALPDLLEIVPYWSRRGSIRFGGVGTVRAERASPAEGAAVSIWLTWPGVTAARTRGADRRWLEEFRGLLVEGLAVRLEATAAQALADEGEASFRSGDSQFEREVSRIDRTLPNHRARMKRLEMFEKKAAIEPSPGWESGGYALWAFDYARQLRAAVDDDRLTRPEAAYCAAQVYLIGT